MVDRLVRKQVIEQLSNEGYPINEIQLVYWEKSGLLTRPLRQWMGRRVGVHATYSPEQITDIRRVFKLKADGYKLAQIRRALRDGEVISLQRTQQFALAVWESA